MKRAISQYLLIIQLPSEHLRSHPVGGADNSQRLLVFFLTAEMKEEETKFINVVLILVFDLE